MTQPLLGVSLTDTPATNVAGFALGTRTIVPSANGDKEYIYAKAEGAITAGFFAAFDEAFDAVSITHALGIANTSFGVAAATMADEDYGWFQINGYCAAAYLGASCNPDVQLYTSGTAGMLDDADITGSCPIIGVRNITVVGGAAANSPVMLNYPQSITVFDSTT